MGTSAALQEEITVKDGRVKAGNFDRYPLLRMADAPDADTILLEAPDGKPRGLGELPIGPIAPAIGNAFFALTGVRLRHLPMTPDRIKAALQT
jgi:isoquinoline 1-oxidoreductase beta subunit